MCDYPTKIKFLEVKWLGQGACAILIMQLYNFYFNSLLKIFFGYVIVISRERRLTENRKKSREAVLVRELSSLLEKAAALRPEGPYFLDANLKFP